MKVKKDYKIFSPDRNSGYRNSGYANSGNFNSGYGNSGDSNSGDRNSGYRNSGYGNSGNFNSGYRNSGSGNSGYGNSGDRNSGHWNSGDWNSGDWNMASNCAGCFNTTNSKIRFFNKETNVTIEEWRGSGASRLMDRIELTKWISSSAMTKEEKEEHPEYKTTGGFLKDYELKVACKDWWSELTDDEKQIIKSIPNFDSEIFCEITGIRVEE